MDSKWFCFSCLLLVWWSLMCRGQQVVGGMEAPSAQAAPSTLAFPLVGQPQTYQDVTVDPNAPCNCTDVPLCLAAVKPSPACASGPQLSCADLSTCSEHATVNPSSLKPGVMLPCQLSCGFCPCCRTGVAAVIGTTAGTGSFREALTLLNWADALSNPAAAATVFVPSDVAMKQMLTQLKCPTLRALFAAEGGRRFLQDLVAAHIVPSSVLPPLDTNVSISNTTLWQGLVTSDSLATNITLATLGVRNFSSALPSDPLRLFNQSLPYGGIIEPAPTQINATLPAGAPGQPPNTIRIVAPSASQTTAAASSHTAASARDGRVWGPGNTVGAMVDINDLRACRGFVHVIDKVLLPYPLDNAVSCT